MATCFLDKGSFITYFQIVHAIHTHTHTHRQIGERGKGKALHNTEIAVI